MSCYGALQRCAGCPGIEWSRRPRRAAVQQITIGVPKCPAGLSFNQFLACSIAKSSRWMQFIKLRSAGRGALLPIRALLNCTPQLVNVHGKLFDAANVYKNESALVLANAHAVNRRNGLIFAPRTNSAAHVLPQKHAFHKQRPDPKSCCTFPSIPTC